MASPKPAFLWRDEVAKVDFLLQRSDVKGAKAAKEAIRESYNAFTSSGGSRLFKFELWLNQSFEAWHIAVKARGLAVEGKKWAGRPPAPPKRHKKAKVTPTPTKPTVEESASGVSSRTEPEEVSVEETEEALDVGSTEEGEVPTTEPMSQPGSSGGQGRPQMAEVKPPAQDAVYARHLRDRQALSEGVRAVLLEACKALGISAAEEQEVAGRETWGSVLREMGEYAISQDIVAKLKAAYEYQGFDARLIARQMREKGVSKLHDKEGDKAGAYMDRLTLVLVGLMRGANLEKVRKGMKEANRANFDVLVKHYGLQSKPVDTTAITLPWMIATFPGMAMDVLKVMEVGPVRHSTMTGLLAGYPRALMFSAFPSLIPKDIEGVTEVLLSAYLLFQHQVSLVIVR